MLLIKHYLLVGTSALALLIGAADASADTFTYSALVLAYMASPPPGSTTSPPPARRTAPICSARATSGRWPSPDAPTARAAAVVTIANTTGELDETLSAGRDIGLGVADRDGRR
jgi:hypothetical protein